MEQVAKLVQGIAGLYVSVKDIKASANEAQVEIPLEYSRASGRRQGLPIVQSHLTFDEPVLTPTEWSEVKPGYSDLRPFFVQVYSKQEIVAEKMRALIQQQERWPRPRDLYDLWYILCYRGERFPKKVIVDLFAEKCRVRSISPNPSLLTTDTLREWNRQAWEAQLAPTLQTLPGYDQVWREWVDLCRAML